MKFDVKLYMTRRINNDLEAVNEDFNDTFKKEILLAIDSFRSCQ